VFFGLRTVEVAVIAALVVLVGLLLTLWLWLRGPDIPYATLIARYAGSDSAFIDLPGDIRLHYRVVGSESRPAVVLLHGYGDSFTSWDGWVPVLAQDFRVYALDLPGHGLTSALPGYALSGRGYSDLVTAFADAMNLRRFAVAGNSMGGGVAWLCASQAPERVAALILVDAAGWPLAPPDELPLAFRILQYRLGRWLLARIDNTPLIVQGLKQNVVDAALITREFVERWAAFQRAPGHREILMSASPASMAVADEVVLGLIRAPTLILHGENDSLIPLDCGRKFERAIPHSRLITYPEVGHLPQIEIPARSSADVVEFLRSVGDWP